MNRTGCGVANSRNRDAVAAPIWRARRYCAAVADSVAEPSDSCHLSEVPAARKGMIAIRCNRGAAQRYRLTGRRERMTRAANGQRNAALVMLDDHCSARRSRRAIDVVMFEADDKRRLGVALDVRDNRQIANCRTDLNADSVGAGGLRLDRNPARHMPFRLKGSLDRIGFRIVACHQHMASSRPAHEQPAALTANKVC